jgi:hypothetical protein
MIIKDQTRAGRWRAGKTGGILLAALGVALAAYALWPARQGYQEAPEGGVFCGAEAVRGGQLHHDGIDFGSASLRSDAQARSGRYACRLPVAESAQYGFTYRQERPAPGRAYKASVWRLKNLYNSGLLAVQLAGEAEQYFQVSAPSASDDQGWEQLEIRFLIPYGKKTEHFSVYVYSEGHTEVFFDDFLIEPLPIGDESFRPEVLHLYLKKESLQALQRKREEALRAGILQTDDGDWVEASLEGEGTGPLAAELRLKGDWLDHLQGQKWSFRVKLAEGQAWRQLRVFSLHTPATRYFLHEWLLHQLWEREDVLTTRYDFVELRLNGESLGLYAYEEHFEKQLVESRQRREGPILKFSEDGYWQAVKRQLGHLGTPIPQATHAPLAWENADIEAFKPKRWEEDPALAAPYEQARLLMEQYRQGRARPAEVFDLERLARYYALCDIANGYHGIAWHNQRFYYNPITSKLEPIGFDGFGGPPERRYALLGEGALNPASLLAENVFAGLFMDEAFAAAYIRELQRLSARGYLSAALDSLYPAWAARLAYLQLEFPGYAPRYEEWLEEGRYVQSLLLPYAGRQSLLAYTQLSIAGQRRLLLRNRHNLPLEVVGYGSRSKEMEAALPAPLVLPAPLSRKYLARLQRDSLIRNFGTLRFLEEGVLQQQAAAQDHRLDLPSRARFLFFRTLGTDSLFAAPIFEYAAPEGRTAAQQALAAAAVRPGGPYRVEGQRIVFPPGRHQLYEDLVLPAGYTVVFEAGAELGLHRRAAFISFSPVQAYGQSELPVKIFSDDASGSFTVMQAAGWSNLSNVWFEGLNTLRKGGWELTGAVTFYESDVRFNRCAFRNNHCEDALNIFRAEFELRHSLFSDTPFDAFDADFSKGIVENCRFLRTGNDGMDFSSSVVNIKNCYLEGNADKALSVGEESDVTFFDSVIKNANIALASKDYSLLYVRGLRLEDCQQGFVAFQKKPEFGPAKIIVESYEAQNVRRLHYIAPGNVLQLENKLIQ